MDQCCDNKLEELANLKNQKRVLIIVLVINALMFFVELSAGILAHSTALIADSLDMLGDALVYGFSLFVLSRSERWQAGASLTKGVIMALFGLGTFAEVAMKMISGSVPVASTMTSIGLLALFANLICLYLLSRHRKDNLNMRSTWLCSRNDIVANVGVLVAAGAVALTKTHWPDVLIGGIIAGVILRSSVPVIRESMKQLREVK